LRFLTGSPQELAGRAARLLEKAQRGEISLRALEAMAGNNVDFVDALLAETARSRSEGIASFDKDFRKLDIEWCEPD
jgi:predicted nucleic acid-binding protein